MFKVESNGKSQTPIPRNPATLRTLLGSGWTLEDEDEAREAVRILVHEQMPAPSGLGKAVDIIGHLVISMAVFMNQVSAETGVAVPAEITALSNLPWPHLLKTDQSSSDFENEWIQYLGIVNNILSTYIYPQNP